MSSGQQTKPDSKKTAYRVIDMSAQLLNARGWGHNQGAVNPLLASSSFMLFFEHVVQEKDLFIGVQRDTILSPRYGKKTDFKHFIGCRP